ncbi:MAG: cation diffusion facilitator family transporter [Candidatus Aenigmarchaeota archaeon]|nr:cation diffusion facilitator family transporter [Candidatus Aenigmarchaeota archaeon]
MEPDRKQKVLRKGERAVQVSAAVSIVLIVLKAAAGLLSGSIALLSSALDSFVDTLGMLAGWLGLKIAQRKPDKRFHYGYYRAETLATLFMSFIILYAALRLLLEGYSRLFSAADISYPLLGLAVAAVNILASFFLSRYLARVGEETSSPLLTVASRERLTDILSGIVVFIAVLTSYLKVPYVEGLVVIGISLLILRVGMASVKDSVLVLMDVSPSKAFASKIGEAVMSVGGVSSYNHLRMRKSGPFVFCELSIRVKKLASVYKAHEIAETVEMKIKEKLGEIASVTVHIEPDNEGKSRIAIPVSSCVGLESKIYPDIAEAPCILFVDVDRDGGKIDRHYVRKNPALGLKEKKCIKAAKMILKEKPDVLIVSRMCVPPFHLLKEQGLVEIYSSRGATAKSAVSNFLKGNLKKMKTKQLD